MKQRCLVHKAAVWLVLILPLFFAAASADAARKLNAPLLAVGQNVRFFRVSPDDVYTVFTADQDVLGVIELYSVLSDGSAPPVKLSAALTAGGDVHLFDISPDSTRVIYSADQDTDDVYELYSVPINGSSAPIKLNTPLVTGGDILQSAYYTFTPDSTKVVYLADQDTDEVFELYVVPADGSSPPIKLNGPLAGPSTGVRVRVEDAISPDGTRVVYVADQDVHEILELYSVPIDRSSAPVKLNSPLIAGRSVSQPRISPDSTRVVYVADQGIDNVFDVFSVPIDGSSTPVKLNLPLTTSQSAWFFEISPDSSRVVYSADQDVVDVFEIYSVPIAGGAPPIKISPPVLGGRGSEIPYLALSSDSRWAVFITNRVPIAATELFSARIDGTGAAIKLDPLPTSIIHSAGPPEISPDSGRVLFNLGRMFTQEVYSIPIDGRSPAVKLNGALIAGGSVVAPRGAISSDSSRAVYLGDQDTDGVSEVYSVLIDGSGAPVKLNDPLVTGGDVYEFSYASPDGTRIVYRADQDIDSVLELYTLGPEELLELLIADVDALVARGVLTRDQGDGLIAKLRAAISAIARGNTVNSCGQLQAFLNQVAAFELDGSLTAAQARHLTSVVEQVRRDLGC